MAPTKSSKPSSKGSFKPKGKGPSSSSKSRKPSADSGISKRKQKGLALAKPGGAQKTKATIHTKKKRRIYSEKELGIPTLNTITPAGVQKVKGQKKGKVFVDDTESMMTILALVNADKDGQIESKMMRAVSIDILGCRGFG
jgi:60S ribosomal subunit assembly/export protein LOC1